MYVCVCQGVTTRQISATIAKGATTFKALRDELGVGTCCGKCCRDVHSQLNRECSDAGGCACAQKR
ncbi:MAG: (2Fe-2S)-binding protein [Rhodocyclales bacterium]|nr:(2Fe-2S)-binding protein [Rhodocyclales bacterium]